MVLISVGGLANPRIMVQLEGLDKLKKFYDLICIRTRDLPYSMAPKLSTQPCSHMGKGLNYIFWYVCHLVWVQCKKKEANLSP
jgi:hypothetical protein